MKTLEQILKTAKKKYQEAIRGRDYQFELLENEQYSDEETELFIQSRALMFTAKIALLEDVFGTKLLQSEN